MGTRDEKKYELRRIERKAKYLLMHKEIPVEKIEIVRKLLKDPYVSREERFRSVIDLLRDCPDKAFTDVKTSKVEIELAEDLFPEGEKVEVASSKSLDIFPTETTLYINNIFNKYKALQFFKKKHIAKTDKGFGFTLRKRLVPSRRLFSLIKYISSLQKKILAELYLVTIHILEDDNIEDPAVFNYIRQFQKWMRTYPFNKHSSGSVKWLQRHDFERELKTYISHFYSFQILDEDTLATILHEIRFRLRLIYQKKKTSPLSSEDQTNKRVDEAMNMLLYFLPHPKEEVSSFAKSMRKKYGIHDLEQLILIILESLIYQRNIKAGETVIPYFKVREPSISSRDWDFNIQMLQRVGKDPESRKRRELEKYQKEIEAYDSLYFLLHVTDDGKNMLKSAALEYLSSKRKQEESMFQTNYIMYLHCILSFFKFAIMPVIAGAEIEYLDKNRIRFNSRLVDSSYFREELLSFELLYKNISLLEANSYNNPKNRDEIRRIMTGANPEMNHVEEYIRNIGDIFFTIGKEFQYILECHKMWLRSNERENTADNLRKPLSLRDDEEKAQRAKPVPFYGTIIYNIKANNPMINRWIGKEIMDEEMSDGLFLYICAFCLQVANECFNKNIMYDLDKRMFFLKKIAELKVKTDKTSIRYA
jgi:hypothetical protein